MWKYQGAIGALLVVTPVVAVALYAFYRFVPAMWAFDPALTVAFGSVLLGLALMLGADG